MSDQTPITLRLLDARDDLSALTALLHRAYAPLAAAGMRFVASHQAPDHTRRRISKGECWVAEVDGTIVGTILLIPPRKERGTPWYEREDVAGIGQFAVDPLWQGKRIGDALLRKAEERAREIGARELALDTAESAAKLIAFYSRRGYRFIEYADWRPTTNYRSVVMSLALDGNRSASPEWYKDPKLWHDLSPMIFRTTKWTNAAAEVEKGIALLRLEPGSRILDMPCGTGRHALEFARRGYRVTGVDLMPFYLDEARERARNENLTVECVQSDIRNFVRPAAFDAVWNYFTSFGYFSEPEDDRLAVFNIFRSLRPGGRLLMETVNPAVSIRNSGIPTEAEIDGFVVIDRPTVAPDGRTHHCEWTLKRSGETKVLRATLRLYGPAEIEELLRGCGFSSVSVFGALDRRPVGPETRLVVMAEK